MKKRMMVIFAFVFSYGTPALAAAPGEVVYSPRATGQRSELSYYASANCSGDRKAPIEKHVDGSDTEGWQPSKKTQSGSGSASRGR